MSINDKSVGIVEREQRAVKYLPYSISVRVASRPTRKHMRKSKEKQKEHIFPSISRKSNLEVMELKAREILQVEGVLSGPECERFIDAAESLGFVSTSSRGAAHGEAYRDNSRISVNSSALADALWRQSGLQEAFKDYRVDGQSASGLNPNIRFYKYVPGNKFGKHVDDSIKVGGKESKYTLLLYLSGSRLQKKSTDSKTSKPCAGLRGGETLFYGGKRSKLLVAVSPEPGLALLHLYGDDCLEHEGAEVFGGIKYVLRSDVLF